MRFTTRQHRFYCGVNLHERTLYPHNLDEQGKTRFERNLAANPETFIESIASNELCDR